LNRSINEKTIPIIGNIPLLGYLFNSRTVENTLDYTVIFMTGHLVRGADDLQVLYKNRFEELDPLKPRMTMKADDTK